MGKNIPCRRNLEEENIRLQEELNSLKQSSIQESTKAADDLREYGEAMFRTIYKQSQHLAAILDLKGMLKHANKSAWAYTLQPPENFKDKPFWQAPWWIHSVLEQEKLKDGILRAVNGELVRFDTTHYNADGILRYMDFSLKPVRNDSGRILCLIAESQDITARNLALEQSRQLANEQRAILYALRIGICHLKNRILQWVNPAFATMFGYEPDELKSVNSSIFYSNEEDFLRVGKEGYARIYDSKVYWTEALMKKKSGEKIWCAISGQAVNPLNADEGSIWVLQDITDRRKAEESLRVSEERFKLMVQYSNDIIALLDAECIQTSVFGPLERILGYKPDELIGKNGFSMVHPDDLERLKNIFNEIIIEPQVAKRIEFRYKHKDGRWITMEAMGANLLNNLAIHSIVLNIRDISERNRLQDQLQQAMKMEAMGRLSGGIAHDFNNLLTAIFGNIDIAMMELSPDDPAVQYFEEIKKVSNSAASLTRQLLAFSRRQIIEPKAININDLISRIQKLLIRILGEDVKLEIKLGDNLGSVKIDPGQFEQVLVNLAVNARDAMPNGGRLIIESAGVNFDKEYCTLHTQIQPGKYVMLALSDSGQGMTEEVKKRIFEPFFTTKPLGRGTGLGLATIFGSVAQAGGTIEVYSELGIGTTFKIYLPQIELPPEKLTEQDSSMVPEAGQGTILLVEDEISVRKMASAMLKLLGYEVLLAPNGEDAIRLFGKFEKRIDLLMTDVVMPGMNGKELAKQLTSLHQEMKVLFTSGYTDNVVLSQGMVDKDFNFIGKPYSVYDLAKKIREVLRIN